MTQTPGPYWMAADNNPADGSDREVWDVGVGDDCLATFDRREDALLYRAAPDMLSTLKQALDDWPDWESDEPVNGGDMVEWFGNWRELAKAAIAKAEGR